jgi:hypothetical protein
MTDKFSKDGPIKQLLTSWQDAFGRTLSNVSEEYAPYDNFTVVRFSDGAGLLFREHSGEYHSWYDLEPETEIEDTVKVFFGLMALSDFEQKEAAKAEQRASEQSRKELVELARLRAKYDAR